MNNAIEEEIRKALETYEAIYAEEEGEISRASKELENIKRTRAFFGFAEMEGEENAGSSGEYTQVRELLDAARAEVRQHSDQVADTHNSTHGPAEGS